MADARGGEGEAGCLEGLHAVSVCNLALGGGSTRTWLQSAHAATAAACPEPNNTPPTLRCSAPQAQEAKQSPPKSGPSSAYIPKAAPGKAPIYVGFSKE